MMIVVLDLLSLIWMGDEMLSKILTTKLDKNHM